MKYKLSGKITIKILIKSPRTLFHNDTHQVFLILFNQLSISSLLEMTHTVGVYPAEIHNDMYNAFILFIKLIFIGQ